MKREAELRTVAQTASIEQLREQLAASVEEQELLRATLGEKEQEQEAATAELIVLRESRAQMRAQLATLQLDLSAQQTGSGDLLGLIRQTESSHKEFLLELKELTDKEQGGFLTPGMKTIGCLCVSSIRVFTVRLCFDFFNFHHSSPVCSPVLPCSRSQCHPQHHAARLFRHDRHHHPHLYQCWRCKRSEQQYVLPHPSEPDACVRC